METVENHRDIGEKLQIQNENTHISDSGFLDLNDSPIIKLENSNNVEKPSTSDIFAATFQGEADLFGNQLNNMDVSQHSSVTGKEAELLNDSGSNQPSTNDLIEIGSRNMDNNNKIVPTVDDEHEIISTDTIETNDRTGNVSQNLPNAEVAAKENVSSISNTETNKSDFTNENDLLLAATLIRDAMTSRNMYFKPGVKYVRSYILFQHIGVKVVLWVCIWAIMLLAVFEKPAIIGVQIPYWGTMIMEIVFLGFFLIRILHNAYFSDPWTFWRDPKNITVIVTIGLIILDMICYVVWVNLGTPAIAAKAVRWSRPLRPLFLINFPEAAQLRRAFRNIRRTLPDIIYVLLLFIASISLFALMAYKLMQYRNLTYPNGRGYFNNYFEGWWDLYVLVTTANNPDVMMPAYDSSRWYALFFVVYLVINLYIFMNIVLAVIYNNYKRHLKNEVKTMVYSKRKLLSKAFDAIKTPRPNGNSESIVTSECWSRLLNLMYPSISKTRVELGFYVLDDNGDGTIEKKEFLKVADLINIEVTEVKNEPLFLEKHIPSFYNHTISAFVRKVVSTRYFIWFFDLLILANAFCIGFSVEEAEYFFLPVFTLEIILKLYTFGGQKFFRSFWNVFDFIVVFTAVILTTTAAARGHLSDRVGGLDFLLALRVLRLVRVMGSLERFRIVLTTIVNIGPSIVTYGAVIFVVYYFYSIIGMEIFAGKIQYFGYENLNDSTRYCGGNIELEKSEFWSKQYCNNNFNDIFSTFVLLFELMVVNQWHVLTEGYVLITNKAARLYFISFHMICVIILLNIFTAFVLEVFILEFTLSKGKLEATVETKIKEMGLNYGQKPKGRKTDKQTLVENMAGEESTADDTTDLPDEVKKDDGLRFKLRKTVTKSIHVILQLMFEGEIDPSDDGADFDQEEDLVTAQANMTLESIA